MLYEDKIFNDFVNKRKGEINALSKQIDFNNFTDNFKGENLAPINLRNHIFLKIFNSEIESIIVWFTDKNSQPLEVEDKINLTLMIR